MRATITFYVSLVFVFPHFEQSLIFVTALASPQFHYESVHDMRRRTKVTYQYTPKFLSAEHCRHWSEAECQRQDEKHDAISRERQLNPSQGNFRVLVLFIVFPEDENRIQSLGNMSYFEDMLNSDVIDAVNPAGSIKMYLKYMSMNQYNVTFDLDTKGWQPAQQSASFYANGTGGKNTADAMQAVFASRLTAMDEEEFDWSPYDSDGDGKLDHLLVLHSGIGAENGNLSCSSNYLDRIWSQSTADSGFTPWKSTRTNIKLGGYTLVTSIGVEGLCSYQTAKMGLIMHEYMHGFGLPDLYDQDWTNSNGPVVLGGIGNFGLMANAYGWGTVPSFPGILDAYSRKILSWAKPIFITQNGLYPVQPAATSQTIYIIEHDFAPYEYLLIENRQPVKWDALLPSPGGLAIYHVDEMAPLQAHRGYPGQPDWPAYHYRVAVLQADGKYDIEQGINMGDEGDFYSKAGMVLGPDTTVWPNTASYQASLRSTNITITVMSDSSFIMVFKVEGIPQSSNSAPSDSVGFNATLTSPPPQIDTGEPEMYDHNQDNQVIVLNQSLDSLNLQNYDGTPVLTSDAPVIFDQIFTSFLSCFFCSFSMLF